MQIKFTLFICSWWPACSFISFSESNCSSMSLMSGRDWLWYCLLFSIPDSILHPFIHLYIFYTSNLSFLSHSVFCPVENGCEFFPRVLFFLIECRPSPLTQSLSFSLSHRVSKDVSVIKVAGANGGISPYADSLHHWIHRWIPHTYTQMWAHPHTQVTNVDFGGVAKISKEVTSGNSLRWYG